MPVCGLAAWLMGHPMPSGSPSASSPLGREGQEGMGPCKLLDVVQLSDPWPLARVGIEMG